jgi:hypothetical protein
MRNSSLPLAHDHRANDCREACGEGGECFPGELMPGDVEHGSTLGEFWPLDKSLRYSFLRRSEPVKPEIANAIMSSAVLCRI